MNFYYGGVTVPPKGEYYGILNSVIWDDWFVFQTTFSLMIIDPDGGKHNVGELKIGNIGLSEGRADVPKKFSKLPDGFFSLGQNESYYEAIELFPVNVAKVIKCSLYDIAYDLKLYAKVKDEKVTRTSLMRYVPESILLERFHKLTVGTAELTGFTFGYSHREELGAEYSLEFEVVPNSIPPTNIHVLIGRNGVGKTSCLHNIVSAGLEEEGEEKYLVFGGVASSRGISGIVNVSFSAFDTKVKLVAGNKSKIRYDYVGLSKEINVNGEVERLTKGRSEINQEFERSIKKCFGGTRQARWLEAVGNLEHDPIFNESKISNAPFESDPIGYALSIFNKFSSGHKIILLTISRLVELVDERTLILLDEPEGHLHPPLLSAFVRALSELLVQRNGVAIIATHSPVVLQEVPSSCVSIINRFGLVTRVRRPEIETFGENVGVLTREIFGLEVSQSGFHRILEEQANKADDYEGALEKFNGQLGAEAKSLLRGMMSRKSGRV